MRQFVKRQRMGNILRWVSFGSLCLVTLVGLVGIVASFMGLYEGEDPMLMRYLYGVFAIDAFGGAAGLIVCDRRFRQAREPAYRRYAELSDAERSDVEADLVRLESGGMTCGSGRLYYYDKFRYLQMVRYDDIAWGYLQYKKRPLKEEEQLPRGFSTLRLQVVLFLKNKERIDLPQGPRARAVLQTLRERLPHISFGYSGDTARELGVQTTVPYWTKTRIAMALANLALWVFLGAMFISLRNS